MLLIIALHPETEAVLVLDPAHEAQVPCLGDSGRSRGACPPQRPVGGEQLGVRGLVHQYQRPVRVQGLLVVSA